MDFIKIPLCACTNNRCKKKPPTIGSYSNQSVQTDIRFEFDRKKTFTSVELGKGEVSAKHSISTSMEIGSIASGRLKTSFDSKGHELYPPSIPIIKETGDAKERSREEMGQDFESEYLPPSDVQEPLFYQSFVEEGSVEKVSADELYAEDQGISVLDEEQRDSGATADAGGDSAYDMRDTIEESTYDLADTRQESTYDMEENREESTYDMEEAREESTYDMEGTREESTYEVEDTREESTYGVEDTREVSTYDTEGAREDASYDVEDTREESTYDMEGIREESTYDTEGTRKDGSASTIESAPAALDHDLDDKREISAHSSATASSDDRTQEAPTTPPAASSISVEPIEQVAETEDFPEPEESDAEPEETHPKPDDKKGKAKKPKVFKPKVQQPRKKRTPPKRGAHAQASKFRTLPNIMLPRKQSFPTWPMTAPVCQSIRCCSNDFLWTPLISNSASPPIRIVPSRISHSIQCDFGSHRANPCDRTACSGDIQQYCEKFCKSTDDISCYRLQTPPNHNHISQSCDAIPRPLGTCNLNRMEACNPPQMTPRLQPSHHQSSGFKNCQNTSNYRKSVNHGCGNVHFRKYCGCNNLHGMFTPYRMCCSYRHAMIHPSMYLYTFAT